MFYFSAARQHGLHMYTSIFTLATMDEMSRRLPITPQEMTNITGVGKARYDNYGARFLEVTQNYATLQAGNWKIFVARQETWLSSICMQVFQFIDVPCFISVWCADRDIICLFKSLLKFVRL